MRMRTRLPESLMDRGTLYMCTCVYPILTPWMLPSCFQAISNVGYAILQTQRMSTSLHCIISLVPRLLSPLRVREGLVTVAM